MTDFYGYRIAKILKELLIEVLGLQITLEQVTGGSPHSVNFEVTVSKKNGRTRSGRHTYHFSGWPDFVIRDYGSEFEYRDERDGVVVVGETQSPPGTSRMAEIRSVAQAGIYSTGHLIHTNKTKCVVMVLTKARGGLVCVTTREDGQIKHRCLHSCEPFDLQQPAEVQKFAQVLASAIEWQLN